MSVYDKIYQTSSFSDSQKEIIKLVGEEKVVLEIGSASGYMTKQFKQNNCIVDIVEIDKQSAQTASRFARNTWQKSVEDESVYNLLKGDYDFIILADVLEHLIFPEQVLKKLLKVAQKSTQLLISMPNIASWQMRKQLFLKGDFTYEESGVLDKTHLHFYTPTTLAKLISDSGWTVIQLVGSITRLPFEGSAQKIPIIYNIYKKTIRPILVERYKNLAYFHFIIIAKK